MTQYDERVQYQRDKLEAEKWAGQVKTLHAHSLDSMWYDTRPQDTADGKHVIDTEFNNGTVRREMSNGELNIYVNALTGRHIFDAYRKFIV